MRPLPAPIAATALASLALILAGCGGGTTTVTSGADLGSQTSSSSKTTATASTKPTAPATTPAHTTATPSGEAQSTTHTAPEPAFTQHGGTAAGTAAAETSGAEAAAAVALVKERGYTPNDTAEYHAGQTLRVLTATRTGSADGYDQRAFFFLDGRYLGTDSSQPSASVRVVSQSDTEVALAYPLYRPHDPLCCPGGGQATVHFQLNDGRLVPLQAIPSASTGASLSRQ
jgi:hypothetical protein